LINLLLKSNFIHEKGISNHRCNLIQRILSSQNPHHPTTSPQEWDIVASDFSISLHSDVLVFKNAHMKFWGNNGGFKQIIPTAPV